MWERERDGLFILQMHINFSGAYDAGSFAFIGGAARDLLH